jgi:NADPH2:quinone reductase
VRFLKLIAFVQIDRDQPQVIRMRYIQPIPERMRAVQLDRHDPDLDAAIDHLTVVSKPVPQPGRGQVLIRIEAAPCNPSDLLYLQGLYGVKKTLPSVPGWEGAGTVVRSGGGVLGRMLLGRRVACAGQADADGTWAEYFVTEAGLCVPLQEQVSFEQGAMLVINPLTALALLERCTKGNHRAAVHTAGASQLGRMLVRLAASRRLPMIHIVRRDEQVEALKALGAEVVLNCEREGFDEALRHECERLTATIALEAVAGAMTSRLLKAMPRGSTAIVYGVLSNEPCRDIDPYDLIFRGQRVEGFWLTPWLLGKGMIGRIRITGQAQKLIAGGVLDSTIRARLGFDQVRPALRDYHHRMSEGKVLICPDVA